MAIQRLDSALLFTPGRASYVTSNPEGDFTLHLTEASEQRAKVAANLFDDQFHTMALFTGGYPDTSQDWPPERTPLPGNREADLMAEPLKLRLSSAGWSQQTVEERVKEQSESTNSIGDVVISIDKGWLDPNDFHRANSLHGIHLVCGALHAIRIRKILGKGLDVDERHVIRAAMNDPYGTPATQFRSKELAATALAKEYAAIAITQFVLKDVRPGNVDDLRNAEQRFNHIAAKSPK